MSTIHRSCIRLLVKSIMRLASVLVLSLAFGAPAWAGPCPGQQQAIEILRSRIKADQERIRRLNIGITASQLQDAVDASEEGRKKAILAAALSLVDGFLMAPEAALGEQSIADYELKNGLGSIGTGQANSLIARIRAEGGAKQALIPLIRELSQISDKTSRLNYLKKLSEAASALKSSAELGAADNSLEEAEALFGIAAALAGKGDVALSLASAIVNSAMNETQIYLMARDIGQLTNTAEAQLRALKVLSAKLQMDVQSLQSIRAADKCEGDVTWQIALQNERIAAAAAGNIDFYNQLLRLHSQIFKQFGFRACESGFYPGGCSSTSGLRNPSTQGAASSCPQFSPQNAQDALQVEHASHKDVCWAYNGRTLIATSSETPDKANKPSPAEAQVAEGDTTAGANSVATSPQATRAAASNSDGRGSKDGSISDFAATKYRAHYVAGETGIQILAPWSETGRGPGWSVGIMRTCSSSALEYRTTYDTARKGYSILPPQEVSVSGAEIARVSPGTYCVLLNFSEHDDEHINPTAYVSGYGFRPFNVEVKPGHTSEVSVPMGILKISLPSLSDSIGCTFKDSEGYDLGIWEMTGGLEAALKPGSYSYVCGGTENDFAAQLRPGFPGMAHPRHPAERQSGSVQISAGKTSKVTLMPRPD